MSKKLSEIPLSVLDLATIVEGETPADAFARSVKLAQLTEKLGYKRYWFAEHHNMESVASSATAVLVGHIAAHTNTIRIGSGGVMLPNHAPLIIAEQFGTLESIYPGRIDLGIGRAPGTDPLTSLALRRNLREAGDDFPNDVMELINYLGPKDPQSKVRAIPGEGTNIPVWLLGSSLYSAQLAALLGLPFAFASHFAPAYLNEALAIYKSQFKPSEHLQQPYAMACVNVIAADTHEEAEILATSLYQMILGMIRNKRRPLQPPVASMEDKWLPHEKNAVMQMMQYSFTGSVTVVRSQLQNFIDHTQIDEIMIAAHIYDLNAKLRSYELLASF